MRVGMENTCRGEVLMELYQQPSDVEIEWFDERMDGHEYQKTKDTISYCSKVSHR